MDTSPSSPGSPPASISPHHLLKPDDAISLLMQQPHQQQLLSPPPPPPLLLNAQPPSHQQPQPKCPQHRAAQFGRGVPLCAMHLQQLQQQQQQQHYAPAQPQRPQLAQLQMHQRPHLQMPSNQQPTTISSADHHQLNEATSDSNSNDSRPSAPPPPSHAPSSMLISGSRRDSPAGPARPSLRVSVGHHHPYANRPFGSHAQQPQFGGNNAQAVRQSTTSTTTISSGRLAGQTSASSSSSAPSASIPVAGAPTLSSSSAFPLPTASNSSSSTSSNSNIVTATATPVSQVGPVSIHCQAGLVQQVNAALLDDRYLLLDLVDGSSLYRCIDVQTQQNLVCKVVNNPSINLWRAHFRLSGHPHINDVQHFMQGTKQSYLFFSQSQGDLHSYVRQRKRLRESEARRLFRQMCEVVKSCHEQGIVLRDLKLRKFVFADAERTHLRLESLEDAVILENPAEDLLQDKRGCPAYVSPEILRVNTTYSGKAADMWSLGVILYTMLVGRYPFNDSEHATLFVKISRGQFQIPECLSSKARCMIRSLLRRDPSERVSSEDLLLHPWMRHDERRDNSSPSVVPSSSAAAASASLSGNSGSNSSSSNAAAVAYQRSLSSASDQCVPEWSVPVRKRRDSDNDVDDDDDDDDDENAENHNLSNFNTYIEYEDPMRAAGNAMPRR